MSEHNNPNDHQSLQEEDALEEMYRLEKEIASLHAEITSNENKTSQITSSRVGKFTRLLNVFGWKRVSASRMDQLHAKIEQLHKRLREVETKLVATSVDQTNYKTSQMMASLRQEESKGTLLEVADRIVDQKLQHEKNYHQALDYIARLFQKEDLTYKQVAYKKILKGLSASEITEFMVRSGFDQPALPIKQAASFRASLTMRMRQLQLQPPLLDWVLDEKEEATHFASKLEFSLPKTADEHYSIATLPTDTGIVVKPKTGAGARGVYLIHKEDYIIDLKRNKKLQSWDELHNQMNVDLETGWVDEDQWMIEELLYENSEELIPARDIKFYTFYGKVGLILEIVRYPELKYCWWNRDGERVLTGKYNDQLFVGNGVSESEINKVEEASLEIPAPFVRMDFLHADRGLIFGEFTPKPGNYDEFNEETDQLLGELFLEAENKLTTDLFKGKNFGLYKEFLKEINWKE
ncbi:ATP-grasp fold amidoligase family protein [Halalkalibacillus halophilus]|uniref:ATP-grasp fold amidoligase family protein n=1 Tax=Halalkalibacillus halophilus TaxID=392827 RepID=UPI000420B9F4|nr:ATP-grasp fold amidoligase family protein [Halalkalibacillus halophilus]